MKRIYVDKPFRLRTPGGVRAFGKGAHTIDEATADHWAMKAWLAEGRYRIDFERPDNAGEPVMPVAAKGEAEGEAGENTAPAAKKKAKA